MFVSFLLFPSDAYNIDLTVCSIHATYSGDIYCYISGNGNVFWYFHRLCWIGYDTKRGTFAFVFQEEVWDGEKKIFSALSFPSLSFLLLFLFFLTGNHAITHVIFFNDSLGKGLQQTVRTVFAWKVEMALYVSLTNVPVKISRVVMETASMRSMKSILKIPAAPLSPAVSFYFCF